MSELPSEQLSALVDGELSVEETRFLLRRIDHDVQLAHSWSRYQIIGSVIRRETLDVALPADFSEVVMQAIAQLPASGSHGGARLLRWVGGGAIAAAVAVVALVATRPGQIDNPNSIQVLATVPSANVAPIDLREPVTPMPVLLNSNFAQPASYDTQFAPVPRYGAYDTDVLNRYSPYLLQPVAPPHAPMRLDTTARNPRSATAQSAQPH